MPATLQDAFTFAVAASILGGIMSYLVEYYPGWKEVKPGLKRVILIGIAVTLSAIVQLVNMYATPEMFAAAAPWYEVLKAALTMAGVTWASAEYAHQKINRKSEFISEALGGFDTD